MNDTRRLHPPHDRSNPGLSVPDSQARALDRRQTLDQQQRTFQGSCGATPSARRRPPA
jgi:hypothetical protein